MAQSIYSRSVTILRQFLSAHSGNFQVIYEPGLASPWDQIAVNRYYGFITDLRMKVKIRSIPEKPLPELDVEQSRTQRITAVRDMEWTGERYQFGLYMECSNSPLLHIASVSLLNRIPYYHVNLMPYFTDNAIINIANDARILGRVEDAGYGLLSGDDDLVIFGSCKEEFTTLPETPRQIQASQSYGLPIADSSVVCLPANPSRLQATFINTSPSATIFLHYGLNAQQDRGIALLPNGGSYEINQTNPYQGIITAIASAEDGYLSFVECV